MVESTRGREEARGPTWALPSQLGSRGVDRAPAGKAGPPKPAAGFSLTLAPRKSEKGASLRSRGRRRHADWRAPWPLTSSACLQVSFAVDGAEALDSRRPIPFCNCILWCELFVFMS